jgi:hypothetical protein
MPLTFPIVLVLVLEFQSVTEALKLPRYPQRPHAPHPYKSYKSHRSHPCHANATEHEDEPEHD